MTNKKAQTYILVDTNARPEIVIKKNLEMKEAMDMRTKYAVNNGVDEKSILLVIEVNVQAIN